MKTETQYALRKDLRPDPNQPRKEFPPGPFAEQMENIRANGILEPLTVRPDPEQKTKWLIVDGERRWRVAGALKLDRLPIAPRDFKDETAVRTYQRIVGTQRLNLSALEEAQSLADDLKARQARDPKFSPTKLGEVLGISRATVYERLSLLKLPAHIMQALRDGGLNASQAVRIGTVQNPASQKRLVEEVKQANERAEPVSVRKLEKQIEATAVKRPANPAGSLKNAKARQAEHKAEMARHNLREKLAEIGESALVKLHKRMTSKPMPEAVWNMIHGTLTRGILNERGDGYGETFAQVCKAYGVALELPKAERKSPRKNAKGAKKSNRKKGGNRK